jgi:hypothetical protein
MYNMTRPCDYLPKISFLEISFGTCTPGVILVFYIRRILIQLAITRRFPLYRYWELFVFFQKKIDKSNLTNVSLIGIFERSSESMAGMSMSSLRVCELNGSAFLTS